MNGSRFETWTRRRFGLAASGFTVAALLGFAEDAEAKRLCRKNGSKCKKKGKRCQAKFCLTTPFTIEARWSNANSDHDTFVFVPKKEGSNDPSPVINHVCNPAVSDCEDEVYPFICVSKDATGPGDEVTTVRRLLAGRYEYWIELDESSPRGDLEVILRNASGRFIRSWSSPANPAVQKEFGWHVFDIDGATRSITAVDGFGDDEWPWTGHNPFTSVCPGVPGFP
jgi:hypothetical protein